MPLNRQVCRGACLRCRQHAGVNIHTCDSPAGANLLRRQPRHNPCATGHIQYPFTRTQRGKPHKIVCKRFADGRDKETLVIFWRFRPVCFIKVLCGHASYLPELRSELGKRVMEREAIPRWCGIGDALPETILSYREWLARNHPSTTSVASLVASGSGVALGVSVGDGSSGLVGGGVSVADDSGVSVGMISSVTSTAGSSVT